MYQVPTYFYLNSYEHMYIKRRRNVYKLGIIHTTLIDLTWITYFEIFVSAKSDKKKLWSLFGQYFFFHKQTVVLQCKIWDYRIQVHRYSVVTTYAMRNLQYLSKIKIKWSPIAPKRNSCQRNWKVGYIFFVTAKVDWLTQFGNPR